MTKTLVSYSSNWARCLSLVLVVMLVLPFMAVTPAHAPAVARAQPVLLQMAAQQPDQVVSVIVQKAMKDDRAEKAVSALGGRVTKTCISSMPLRPK